METFELLWTSITVMHVRLLRSIELQPAHAYRLARFHGDRDRGRECDLPGGEELYLDIPILLDACIGNLLPCGGVAGERLPELVCLGVGRRLESCCRLGRGAPDRVRECLVLMGRRRRRGGGGQIRALQVSSGKVSDALPDSRAQLRDRLLDCGGVVIRLGLVDLRDPMRRFMSLL